eukprot:4166840-Prymnesium_polylepis.3
MHGTPHSPDRTDRRCPVHPRPESRAYKAYVPRSTAVAFVHNHKPALHKPADQLLDSLRCQQLLPVHVVDTLHRDVMVPCTHAHIRSARAARTPTRLPARCVSNSYKPPTVLVHRRCPHRLQAGPRQPPCPGSIGMV